MSTFSWSTAFRKQAQSDFELYLLINKDPKVPMCHHLHYLQMALEKIAKAHYHGKPPQSHYKVVDYMLQKIGETDLLAKRYGWTSKTQFKNAVARIRPMLDLLQSLVPQQDEEKVNAEYPWRGSEGVVVPCEYDYLGAGANAYAIAQLVWFLKRLLRDENRPYLVNSSP
jgi:hypothetical protein